MTAPKAFTSPPKRVKLITKSYLKNAALYYLERFASTRTGVLRVLNRRIKKSAQANDINEQIVNEWKVWAEEVVQDLSDLGLISDESFARAKITSLRRRGDSTRMIQGKLKAKGVPTDLLTTHLDTSEEQELEAAENLTRRLRIGKYRKKSVVEPEDIQKEFAKLARAGFSYHVAKKVLKPED